MHTAKVHLLQSVVSRLLVELVFEAFFVGLSPDQTRQFSQMAAFLSSIGKFLAVYAHPNALESYTPFLGPYRPFARFARPFLCFSTPISC